MFIQLATNWEIEMHQKSFFLVIEGRNPFSQRKRVPVGWQAEAPERDGAFRV
jgi:hypothetical protein